jgi:hypothetical protein
VLTYAEIAGAVSELDLDEGDVEELHGIFEGVEIELVDEIDPALAAAEVERVPAKRTRRKASVELKADMSTDALQLFLKDIGKRRLLTAFGREPTAKEIAEVTGIEPEEVDSIKHSANGSAKSKNRNPVAQEAPAAPRSPGATRRRADRFGLCVRSAQTPRLRTRAVIHDLGALTRNGPSRRAVPKLRVADGVRSSGRSRRSGPWGPGSRRRTPSRLHRAT